MLLQRAMATLALPGLALLVKLALLLLGRARRRAPRVIRPHPIELERPFAGLALDRALVALAPLTVALPLAAIDRSGMVGRGRAALSASVPLQHLCLKR
jgi:hypothetical protein